MLLLSSLIQGKVEEYGSNEELLSKGVDPTMLLGLKNKEDELNEFAVREEEEDEEEGGVKEKNDALPQCGSGILDGSLRLTPGIKTKPAFLAVEF